MRNIFKVGIPFAVGIAVVLAAMGHLTNEVLRIDAADRANRRNAAREEKVRLALWRMDSRMSILTATEGAHLPEEYVSPKNSPSPLLLEKSEFVLVHFQFDGKGTLSSPEVPEGVLRQRVERDAQIKVKMDASSKCVAMVRASVDPEVLKRQLPVTAPPADTTSWGAIPMEEPYQQTALNNSEYSFRSGNVAQRAKVQRESAPPAPAGDFAGPMKALWIGKSLVLARHARNAGAPAVQGCLLDGDAIRITLLASVRDLLPEADLLPIAAGETADPARALVELPFRLSEGAVPGAASHVSGPLRMSLVIAWGCLLAGIVAAGILLWGTIRLSERRAAFVSAVTHELRTPLTTFRMYTEMLAGDMVTGEKRKVYFETLLGEAVRLSHLIENVLAYARLERGRAAGKCEYLAVSELIERIIEPSRKRAADAGMELRVEPDPSALAERILVDASAADQILFNLVDNAAKYAAAGSNKILHLEPICKNNRAGFRFRDHGPGVGAKDRLKLFKPFTKLDRSGSTPGVGLGLALSRRLAREMRGELLLDNSVTDGAGFLFLLPKVEKV